MTDGPGLVLLFTPGVSVRDWQRAGYVAREVSYFRALGGCVGPVAFATDGADDAAMSGDLGGIAVVDRRGLPRLLHRATLPFRLARMRPRIVRTNQLAGATVAVLTKWLSGARLVARGGYVGSEPWRHGGRWSLSRLRVVVREALLCRFADLVLVTSSEAADAVRRSYRLPDARVAVLPNFADTAMFAPAAPVQTGLVTMVGRLSPEKNVISAVEAVSRVPGLRLRVVGDGPLRGEVAARYRALGADVELVGTVEQPRLAALLRESEIFLLPSHYEGHSKALLEAMAAGVPAVVAPSPGIATFVRDGIDAHVASGTDAGSLAAALAAVHADPVLRHRLAAAARERVEREYSLDAVVAAECELYRSRRWIGR